MSVDDDDMIVDDLDSDPEEELVKAKAAISELAQMLTLASGVIDLICQNTGFNTDAVMRMKANGKEIHTFTVAWAIELFAETASKYHPASCDIE